MRGGLLFICLLLGAQAAAQAQARRRPARAETLTPREGVTGTLLRHAQFPSRFVAARNVDVWLPPGYARDRRRRYPVLYMHDGQNLFDPKTSYAGVDWGVDEALDRLVEQGVVREAIVVGVWNTPRRLAEYTPRKAAPAARAAGEAASDEYLKFIVRELKPFVDSNYRTRPGRADTFVMGSSMGGLVSAYAVCEYPRVFGGAGCVSTHWPAAGGAAVEYLRTRLPDPRTHKFYFDLGTETLDAQYEPFQKRVDALMMLAGYTEGVNWVTRRFEGEEHSERSWRKRVDIPLVFFLHK
ncbi:MAG TPA: alpha/beta hydrolase-fold protein [Pyrinomonadaceae bacterium]|jgi:predicted alpha/beta superfamily hydrolase